MPRNRKRNKNKKSKRIVRENITIRPKLKLKRNVSMYSAEKKCLLASLLDPFGVVPPLVSSLGAPTFPVIVFDRQLLTLGTDGSAAYGVWPVVTSSTATYSSVNWSLPVTANHGNAWNTANFSVGPWAQQTTISNLAKSTAAISGGIRIVPTGVMTGSSGIIFGGPIARLSTFFAATSPGTTLSVDTPLHTAQLADGAVALWRPQDVSELCDGDATTNGAEPYKVITGVVAGILGGQSGQTFMVESIFHLQAYCNNSTAQVMPFNDGGLTQVEAQEMYRLANETSIKNFIPKASMTPTVYKPMGRWSGASSASMDTVGDGGFLGSLASSASSAGSRLAGSIFSDAVNVAAGVAAHHGRRLIVDSGRRYLM